MSTWWDRSTILDNTPLYQDYEMHVMVTQGIRDRKTLRVNDPKPDTKDPPAR